MRAFIAGMIFVVVAFVLAMWLYTRAGYMPVNADVSRSRIETYLAGQAFDKSVERQAAKFQNPVQPTEENLMRGMAVYTMNCAFCHGSPSKSAGIDVGEFTYPPAPQFSKEPPDMPAYQNYWVIKHGVRYTAMPSWGKVLSEDDLWKLATFLTHWKDLPPAVKKKFEQ